jgi:hypothetical protein
MDLARRIAARGSEFLLFAVTPPRITVTPERAQEIADVTQKRVTPLGLDGLVLYDIDDESGRNAEEAHTCPATRGTSTATLTTPALNRRSLRWFGISACTANPEGPPPSLVQHASCWRSSTSSPLHFRTHAGCQNSVLGR